MGDCEHKYGSFTIKRALGSVGTDAFADELLDEIQENDSNLELDFYCQNGGYVDEVTVEDISINEPNEDGIVSGQFSISLSESYHAGCRDIEWTENYNGTMSFNIDLTTGLLEITGEKIERVYDEEEHEEVE